MTKRQAKKNFGWYFDKAYDGYEKLSIEVGNRSVIIHSDQPTQCDYKTTTKYFNTQRQAEKYARRFTKKFHI